MGKGDKKSKRGKRIAGSFGVKRKRKASSGYAATPKKKAAPKTETEAKPAAKKTTAKKPAAKKTTTKKAADKK